MLSEASDSDPLSAIPLSLFERPGMLCGQGWRDKRPALSEPPSASCRKPTAVPHSEKNALYRGTLLKKKRRPTGPYSRLMLGPCGGPRGGCGFFGRGIRVDRYWSTYLDATQKTMHYKTLAR